MAKLDYQKLVADIIENIGGPENVRSVTHCVTRLRFVLKDFDKADKEKVQNINGVLGVVISGGQFQVVLGQNVLQAFDEVTKSYNFTLDAPVTEVEKEDMESPEDASKLSYRLKKVGSNIFNYVAGSVTVAIPALVAGGMLKVVLLLVTLALPSFSDTSTYTLLSILADAGFYFMPVILAYGAAQQLGCTTSYAVLVAAALIAPNFTALVSAGDPITMFGLPVRLVSYSSSLVPALLSTFTVAKLEKFFNKIIPGIFKTILVGLLTVGVAGTLTFTILGPVGVYVGDYVVSFFVWLQSAIGPFALAILAAVLPFMVMTGMHSLLGSFMVQALSTYGYDSLFRPAFFMHNIGEGGACLGVALRTKNKDLRAQALSAAAGCILAGVTEPAIYGVNLRLKRPLIGVMAGGFAGGAVASILGARAYVMGYSTIFGVAIYQDTVWAILIAVAVNLVVSTTVTAIIGFKDVP